MVSAQAVLNAPSRARRGMLRPWLSGAAFLIAILATLAFVHPAQAQTNCTGVPAGGRSQNVDRNGNGTIDAGETVVLERCRQITFDIGGTTKTVRVHYTEVNGLNSDRLVAVDGDGDGSNETTPQQIADQIVLWTRNAWTTYRNYGFNDPMGRNDMNVHVFDMRGGLAGWCCTSDNYEIDTPSVLPGFRFDGDRRGPESIVFHEMWHAAEWKGGFGCWVNEGTASNMTDHVNTGLDLYPSNDYIGRVRGYLGWGTETSLTNHCYDGALWWKYFMQETGTVANNLDQGVSAMHDFWRNAGTTDFTRMDNVIRANRPGRTLESLWIDFAVANYAKEYGGPAVTARYRYLDEQEDPSAPDYPAPRLTGSFNLNAGAGVGPTLTDVNAWSSQYYQFAIDPAVPIINLEVRQDVNKRLGYVLLLMRNNDVVEEIRSVGRDFVRTFANSNYTRMVLIVVGLNEYANYRFVVNGTTPTLNILDPLNVRKALAGRIDAPDKILIKVEVLSPTGGGSPVPGIDPNTFTVTVGSRVVQPADRISAAYVQGQYWLLMRAPTQTVAGDYTLRVDYAGLTDSETNAVRYQNRNDFDNVLIIDRSGSMGFFGGTPLASAKDAARLYVDGMRVGDKIGVVGFEDTADPALFSLRDWDNTSRTQAFGYIDGLNAEGGTCIGCGLQAGLDQLVASGVGTHGWALIVLSDGRENVGAIANFITNYNTRRNAGQQVPVVHTVALGPDADRARLEKLAADTGGIFSFAAIPAAGFSTTSVNATPLSLSNNLGEIYRVIGEEVAGQQQVYAETTRNLKLDAVYTQTIPIDGAVSEAIFVVKVDTDRLNLGAILFSPDGTEYPNPDRTDDRHLVWRIPNPLPGEWKMQLTRFTILLSTDTNAPQLAEGDEVLVEAAVVSDLTLDVFLGLPVDERLVGKPMPIFATLADSAPVTGANVQAFIYGPTGGFYTVKLYDDGLHDDGAANDGFYGNIFYQTGMWGSYDVVVTASGVRNGEAFLRRQRLGFSMLETRDLDNPTVDPNVPGQPGQPGSDTDNDGMPDWWEEEHGLDPNSDDSKGDPDQDGLSNGEEYDLGTDPNHSDSDGGGHNDGSENSGGTNPLDAQDDQIPCPLFFQAETVYHDRDEHIPANAVILYYDVAADYASVSVWRATDANGSRNQLANQVPATGVYTDTTAALNIPYFYWLAAYDAEGHASCVLGPEEITRTSDPIHPEGLVVINNGARATTSITVTLRLDASPDTTHMQIRNRADQLSEDQGWEPYQPQRAWTLAPEGNFGSVFVLFRDGAGNVSEPGFDSIEIVDEPAAQERDLYLPSIQR